MRSVFRVIFVRADVRLPAPCCENRPSATAFSLLCCAAGEQPPVPCVSRLPGAPPHNPPLTLPAPSLTVTTARARQLWLHHAWVSKVPGVNPPMGLFLFFKNTVLPTLVFCLAI